MGIRIDAVEPGNEINYSAYNGDLVVYRKARRRTPRSVSEVADSAAFERGLDAYVGGRPDHPRGIAGDGA